MGNYISASEAFNILNQLDSADSLISQDFIENIISMLSVSDKNATTILYTTEGTYNGDISMQRYIGYTEAYDFIESERFKGLIKEQIAIANGMDLESFELNKMVNDYINGNVKYVNFKPTVIANGTTGPWADVSRRFVAETTGDVIICIGDMEKAKSRILWNTEVPILITESKCTSANGVPFSNYKFMYNQFIDADTALERVREIVCMVPQDNINPDYWDNIMIYYDDQGKIIDISTEAYEIEKDYDGWEKYDDNGNVIYKTPPDCLVTDDAYSCSSASLKDSKQLLDSLDGNIEYFEKIMKSAGNKYGCGVAESLDYINMTQCDSKNAIQILECTNNNLDDAMKIVSNANGDAENALKILTSTNNNLEVTISVLESAGGDAKSAANILNFVNNIDDALRILEKANGETELALKILDYVDYNVNEAISIIDNLKSNAEIANEFPETWNSIKEKPSEIIKFKLLEFETRNVRQLIDSGEATFEEFLSIKNCPEFNEYISGKGFETDLQIKQKYTFLNESTSADVLDKIRYNDYRLEKMHETAEGNYFLFNKEAQVIDILEIITGAVNAEESFFISYKDISNLLKLESSSETFSKMGIDISTGNIIKAYGSDAEMISALSEISQKN